ncbi:MAG TPA: hypothetical protein VFQ00_06030 [Terriglobales bacterium]|nr:hypothetical protein [Terriglobales bacterium]
MKSNVRLALALLAYAVLAILAWWTMQPDKVRLVTFAILGLLAFRTITHFVRMKREEEADRNRETEATEAASYQPPAAS